MKTQQARRPRHAQTLSSVLLALALLLSTLTAFAQSGNGSLQLTQSVIAGGGGQASTGGNFSLDGTIGQSLTDTSSGGTFSLASGFWPSVVALTPTSLAVSNVTGVYGGTVTLTATLSANGMNLSGKSISFTINGNNVGSTNTDSNGLATLNNVSLSGLNAGTYPAAIGAAFAADQNYALTGGTAQLTVQKATPLVQVAGGAFPFDGQPHPAIVSVTGVNNEALSPVTVLYNGNSTVPVNAGTYTVTASFAGSQNYSAATNNQQSIVITQASQTITFGALTNKIYGDALFTVSATASSGLTVGFSSQTPAVCTVSGNTVTLLAAGTCTIRASQAGNNNYNAATNVAQSFTINQASTTTTVTASPNPANPGQSVTFTATVSSSAGTPSGSVQFQDNGANLGNPVALNGSGVATFSTSSLSAGTHTITALYSGDTNFTTSTGTLTGGEVVNVQSALSINDLSQAEGNAGTTNFTFTVTLSATSTQTVTVNYATANVTATAGSDYQATSGTLTFAPGETSKSITVVVNGDTANEPDETFTVTLSAPTNATLAKAQGTGTILNDDAPGIQFSQSAYTVGEGDGRATLTVTRTGDLTQAASVNYATSDTAGLTPCSTANGIASQRCDYAITIGRLNFAAGESAKAILIPIIDDSYVEGTEIFTLTLSNAQGATLDSASTATIAILDNDPVAGTNPIDNVAFFVRQQYIDFLNREPEPQGFAGWQSILNNCPSSGVDGNGNRCDRVEVSSDFYRSEEFQSRGYFIYRFYETLGRMPRYAEFMPDMARVSGFLTTMDLETMKTAFVQSFMARAEFQARYGALTDATAYVDALLQAVGLPNHRQRVTWIGGLNAGTLSRGDVLRQLIESPELSSRFYNEAFVIECYFGYLRRDPDALFQNWLTTLNQTNDYRTLVNGFVNALEYRQRFGQ